MTRTWLLVSQLATLALLAAGFPTSERWLAGALLPAAAFCWYLNRRSGEEWPLHLQYGLSLLVAAVGLHLGGTRLMLLAAAVSALAAWDLARFAGGLQGDAEHPLAQQAVRKHLRVLGAVCAGGLLLTAAGSQLQLDLPFGLVLGLAVLIGLALEGLTGTAGETGNR